MSISTAPISRPWKVNILSTLESEQNTRQIYYYKALFYSVFQQLAICAKDAAEW